MYNDTPSAERPKGHSGGPAPTPAKQALGGKKSSTIFLQIVLVIIAIAAVFAIIRFPPSEGRAQNLDLISIYFKDPFLWYAYIASVPFFVGLYQAFKLLTYIGGNKVFSLKSVKALRTIKYCAIILSVFIVGAAVYVRVFHAPGDDPAGFIALCILTTFTSIVTATAAAVFEKLLKSAVDIKSENDLTV
jgi:hypothetical protein